MRKLQYLFMSLAAMLLAHWDNKAPNQRLVCLAREDHGLTLGAALESAACPLLGRDIGGEHGSQRQERTQRRHAEQETVRVGHRLDPGDPAVR